MKTTHEGKRENFLLAWIRGSVILQMLDRLSEKIYRSFSTGFFGWLFTGYIHDDKSILVSRIAGSGIWKWMRMGCRYVSRQIEESLILGLFRRGIQAFLRCRMRTLGLGFFTFGLYTAAFQMIKAMIQEDIQSLPDHPELLFALGVICFSVPLLLSKTTVCASLCSTPSGLVILEILGWDPDQLKVLCTKEPVRYTWIFFAAGILCGVLTFFVPPWWIAAALVLLSGALLILYKPEIGVLALFFGMPLLPTMILAGLVIYVFLCFLLKLIRGKRIIHVEPLDIMTAAFAVILFFGGTVSLSSGSLKPALLFVCFLMGYFETVWLLRERKWLIRCSVAGVLSAALTSLYGIFQYLTGTALMAEAWVDSEMFKSIGGRAVGTLENPNMLGEYLVLMIPLAVVMLIGHGEGLRRLPAFVCLGIMGGCLILTWSRGAWLGLIFAAVLFLFIWHKRAIWLMLAGLASVPFLPYILPESIIYRFTSIGNLSDSSTSYRVYIWRAACDMIRDFGWTGIGIGEEAWDRVYPLYAYQGVEAAPHSHNLFLQIWLETGICGLALFLVVLFMLCQSMFTLCRDLRDCGKLSLLELRNMEKGSLSGSEFNAMTRRTRTQLRISCAAPLTGVFAVLVQGMTDYSWYNYRVYLMFWLMIGLASAYVRSGRTMMMGTAENRVHQASVDLPYQAGSRMKKTAGDKAEPTAEG
ncbi:MAG: O-antigen ligase family protein [Clostridia bacterium]|nr:O-antigen ligase family protein [Clostridia bacterium]